MSKQQATLYEPLPVTPRSYARPGGPNGYGAAVWPPPVPDRRGAGSGRVVAGVVIGSLILVCTLLGGFLLLTGGGSKAAGGARYRLTAPERVAGFRMDSPVGRTFRTDHLERLRSLGVRDAGSVTAGYSSARGKLMFSGIWGEVRDPERAVDGMFEAMAEDARREPVRRGAREEVMGSPERVSVDGAVMKCQPVSFTPAEGEPGTPLTLPYCVWADHSTLGVVGAALGERTEIAAAAEAAGMLRRAARG
ncbi:hypothetical protein [Streptomyces roseoverticillatus]|uniref:hypothetical protein n=1 Tax=Streptomyces roseoverticillatus TaxID=66429 RepID=UPI0004BFFF98|nr:hypothetical protein [Streptomyces roseoverticillatus]